MRRPLALGAIAVVLAGAAAAEGRVPIRAQIEARLAAAVRSSRAHLTRLVVDTRTRKLRLDVAVSDPAPYLKHRYARVVEIVYPALVSRFASIVLHVIDTRSSRAVLSYSDVVGVSPGGRTRQESWHIAWRYLDCARNLPLDDIEIDPDHAAPPCPAD